MQRLASGEGRGADRGSHRAIWLVLAPTIAIAAVVAKRLPAASFVLGAAGWAAVAGLFAAGTFLRWWAIRALGRWFTVRVAIRDGHRLVTTGPYAWLRHPGYAGALLQLLALGLSLQHVLALLLVVGASAGVFARRIVIEESLLAARFGGDWIAFARQRARVLPRVW